MKNIVLVLLALLTASHAHQVMTRITFEEAGCSNEEIHDVFYGNSQRQLRGQTVQDKDRRLGNWNPVCYTACCNIYPGHW